MVEFFFVFNNLTLLLLICFTPDRIMKDFSKLVQLCCPVLLIVHLYFFERINSEQLLQFIFKLLRLFLGEGRVIKCDVGEFVLLLLLNLTPKTLLTLCRHQSFLLGIVMLYFISASSLLIYDCTLVVFKLYAHIAHILLRLDLNLSKSMSLKLGVCNWFKVKLFKHVGLICQTVETCHLH